MKLALVLLMTVAAFPGHAQDQSTDLNVNSRYTVESVDLSNQRHYRLSTSILDEMHRLIGSRLNDEAVKRLANRIRGELRAMNVTFKLLRGGNPESVKVLFEVEKGSSNFDLAIPKFAYNSRQGWTGVGEATARIDGNAFTFGGLTDGDSLVERFTGIKVKYERSSFLSNRVSLAFEFDGYHEQYNRATLDAMAADSNVSSLGAGAYRSRVNFEPSATFVLAKPLTLTIGLSFEQLRPQVYGRAIGIGERCDKYSALSSALDRFGRHQPGAGCRLQPARGHQISRLRTWPIPAHMHQRALHLMHDRAVDRSGAGRGHDLRPSSVVRALCTGRQRHAAGLE